MHCAATPQVGTMNCDSAAATETAGTGTSVTSDASWQALDSVAAFGTAGTGTSVDSDASGLLVPVPQTSSDQTWESGGSWTWSSASDSHWESVQPWESGGWERESWDAGWRESSGSTAWMANEQLAVTDAAPAAASSSSTNSSHDPHHQSHVVSDSAGTGRVRRWQRNPTPPLPPPPRRTVSDDDQDAPPPPPPGLAPAGSGGAPPPPPSAGHSIRIILPAAVPDCGFVPWRNNVEQRCYRLTAPHPLSPPDTFVCKLCGDKQVVSTHLCSTKHRKRVRDPIWLLQYAYDVPCEVPIPAICYQHWFDCPDPPLDIEVVLPQLALTDITR